MTETSAKAGEYELVHPWRQADPTVKGLIIKHQAGDVVTLNASDAERLVNCGAAAPKGTKAAKAKEAANDAAAKAKTAAENAAAEAKAASAS